MDRPEHNQAKPGNWNDGVREPRVILGPLPNRDLLAKPEKTPRARRVVEHRAANQPFAGELDGDATPPTAEPVPADS